MTEVVNEAELNIFLRPCRLGIYGYSGSGKTYLLSKLIRKYYTKFNTIIVIGSQLENLDDLKINYLASFNPFEETYKEPLLLVFDDILLNKDILKIASEVFIRGRHKNISSVFLGQNPFYQDKYFRLITLNCSHIILSKCRDINQISCLAKTFLEKEKVKDFVALYRDIVLSDGFGYLLIDFTKALYNKLFIRTNIADEGPIRAFEL